MKSAIARREKILEILSERRYEKMINLAQELKVTRRTIVEDIAVLSETFPIYNIEQCKGIIENIFSKQRSDGWYPRQVPFGSSDKFDLRQFVDSACFFTEFVYDYLAYSSDYSILEKEYGYYDMPAIQMYTGMGRENTQNAIRNADKGGVALEPQFVPNAINIEKFDKPILIANKIGTHYITLKF